MRAFALIVFLLASALTAGAQSNAADTPFQAEAVQLDVATGVVHGTLLVPDGEGSFPVVLLHPGSGPTDRDGNTQGLPGQNNSLRLLAEALAAEGLASLRVDKRGVGESRDALTSEVELRFDHYVDDAAAWLERLRDDERFSAVVAGGHSEGALIALLAGKKVGADAALLVASPGRPAGDLLREQLGRQLPPALYAQADAAIRAIEAGDTSRPSPTGLEALFRPSVQPYLASWLRYDPVAELAGFDAPALVVQGTTDLQVGVADAEALAGARPGVDLVVLTGMNHVLKPVAGDLAAQMPSYSDPALPLAPGLVEAVATFVHGLAE